MNTFSVGIKELTSMMQLGSVAESAKILEELGGTTKLSEKLCTDLEKGIIGTDDDVAQRQAVFGSNFIPPKRQKNILELMWEALQDFTLILLLCSATLSLILSFTLKKGGDGQIEGIAIIVTVLAVVFVSSINDYQKEKQFRKLNAVKEDESINVWRNGAETTISIFKLCVGDIVKLSVGDIIPSDGLVIRSSDLKVNESSLTGESDDIKKNAARPWLYSGTKVMEGEGKMLVTAVGPNSQSGIIKTLIMNGKASTTGTEEKKEKKTYEEEGGSVLQLQLEILAKRIAKAGSIVAVFTVILLFIRFFVDLDINNKEWKNEFIRDLVGFIITGVTIAVVAIPEGLPLAVTLSLAYSVRKMLADNNLVRHLDACETMGSATTICSDKTGTLTTNRMTVMSAWFGRNYDTAQINSSSVPEKWCKLLSQGISLNSTSRITPEKGGDFEYIGNKTECALLKMVVVGFKSDYATIRSQYTPLRIITFSSERKRMSVILDNGDNIHRIYTKGGPDIIFPRCSKMLNEAGEVVELTAERQSILEKESVDAFSRNGLRTLALAYRDCSPQTNWATVPEEDIEKDLVLCAIFGIEDPVRPQVPAAIEQCKHAGIVVRMVTGDNKMTAESIAKKCGIYDGTQTQGMIMEGPEFRRLVSTPTGGLNQQEFDKIWPNLRVLARSSPQDKFLLVSGLKNTHLNGDLQVVAVTGDGTNDGPALKKADVGFAMGITGTAVAKDASDIILMDDNFNSIVKAVMWGRNVHESISKFLQFQLTVNLSAICIAFIGAAVLKESPLRAVQLLWVNLIMDTFASLALSTEPPTPELLERKPYKRDRSLLSPIMVRNITGHALWQIFIILLILFRGEKFFDIESGRNREYGSAPSVHYTLIFNTFVMMQLFNEINAHKINNDYRVFKGFFDNYVFLGVLVGTFWTQVILVQFGGRAFGSAGLNVEQWFFCLGLGLSELVINLLIHQIPPNLSFFNWMSLQFSTPIAVEEESGNPKEAKDVKEGEIQDKEMKHINQGSDSLTSPV